MLVLLIFIEHVEDISIYTGVKVIAIATCFIFILIIIRKQDKRKETVLIQRILILARIGIAQIVRGILTLAVEIVVAEIVVVTEDTSDLFQRHGFIVAHTRACCH